MNKTSGIFSGLNVLELASVLAGPAVGQFFAELGANVIKVENNATGGDVTRSWKGSAEMTDDRSAYFCSVNWGKKSIAIDLRYSEGRDIIHRLAKNSAIVIASYKPGDAEKLNVDYQALAAIKPDIIYGRITGYGSNNPRVGYDAIIQAESGFMYMNGLPDGPSLKMPVALMDILAAHHLKEALLLALLEKANTGQGKLVEVSLIQSAISSLANQATNWLVANNLPEKQGSAHPNIAPYGDVFTTKDGKELLLAIGSDRQFSDLCSVLGIPKIATDPRFSSNHARVSNRLDLNRFLLEIISQRTENEIINELHKAKIPCGSIQNMEKVFSMVEANELLMHSGELMGVRTFANVEYSTNHFLPPPHLGEHTEQILLENLGFSRENLENHRKKRIIS